MFARLSAFVIWAAVAASAVYWALRLGVESPTAPAHTTLVDVAAAGRADWSRVLGGDEADPDAQGAGDVEPSADPGLASRLRLVGVVAPKAPSRTEGVALIAVDDAPAKAFRVGAVVEGQTVLQSVHAFGAELGPRGGGVEVRLQLPALPPPATGTLAAAGASPGGAARVALPRPGGAVLGVPRPGLPPPVSLPGQLVPTPAQVQSLPPAADGEQPANDLAD
ncbi:hypothetical protein [Azohydromonas sp.]|uniref:hypothetical protein n=1 Tax=Azohydromonas sp. TaxID=1872666 RepID=UPI002B7E567D|nr:hypothetical protein [Azohydromonas sp.]HMM84461.1 type II secretion system protein N [Azohydromonas sp.]